MSDFDKQQTPGVSAEKKKMAVAGTLGGVLLVIGAFHFMKATPQTASAGVVGSTSGAEVVSLIPSDETPAQAQAALQQDPTAKLLRGEQDDGHTFDAVPHNPFRIAPEWESLLVRADPPAPSAQHTDYAVPAIISPRAVDTASLKLTGIFRQGQRLYAIINGDIYTAGMTVDTAKILDITGNQVTLQRADAPTGPKATLAIEPKLK